MFCKLLCFGKVGMEMEDGDVRRGTVVPWLNLLDHLEQVMSVNHIS